MHIHIAAAFVLCLGLSLADSVSRLELLAQSQLHPEKHGIHGIISEDASPGAVVKLDPPLQLAHSYNKEICGFTIYKSESDTPFTVELLDRKLGTGRILVADGHNLDYETKKYYYFHVAAKDCSDPPVHSRRVKVHVHVNDTNEHKPQFEQMSYVVEVLEGRKYDQILLLKASDLDGSEKYSRICHYHVLTPNVPFEITQEGVFRNTEALDYSHNHNYILEVKAEDCGKEHSLSSDKILISVKVKEGCKPGWKGIDDRIEYVPGSQLKAIGPQASLDTCNQCSERKVKTTIRLTTDHIGKGCDRDTYAIQSQRKLCGASSGSIDLLPSPKLSSWTKNLPTTDDGNESDQIYSFDGKNNAVEIPDGRLNHTLGSHFTISTWMKHSEDPEDNSKHGKKEHIICNSDGEMMSRHHYSLFLHNCKLVMLLRQEADDTTDMNVFKPAEWRWKISQICDGEWHHYAVSVDFPQVRLYIDGKLFTETDENPDIVDDWPLHHTKIHYNKFVVGACWQGGSGEMDHYFKGYLAGLSILTGKTESDRVIKCLNNCKEKLDFQAIAEMQEGMTISFNNEMTEIKISGPNRSMVEMLVRHISYINARNFPTPGNRALSVSTEIVCEDGQEIMVPTLQSNILVIQAEKPIITISAEKLLSRKEKELKDGIQVFDNLHIISRTRKEEEEIDSLKSNDGNALDDSISSTKYKLDACVIELDSNMNSAFESFKYPARLATEKSLDIRPTEKGLIISGADRVNVYEEILRDILYVNERPGDFNDRKFTLMCSELNGRFKSNAFQAQVNVIHTTHQSDHAHAQANQLHAQSQYKPVGKLGEHSLHLEEQNSFVKDMERNTNGASAGMIVIIVVCVGFLMFMIVLGIIRIRAAHQRDQVVSVEERQEMEWDNSALNITVNPMEQDNVDFETEGGMNPDDSDSDDDSDIISYQDDLDSSEEETEKLKGRELEWDDSTF